MEVRAAKTPYQKLRGEKKNNTTLSPLPLGQQRRRLPLHHQAPPLDPRPRPEVGARREAAARGGPAHAGDLDLGPHRGPHRRGRHKGQRLARVQGAGGGGADETGEEGRGEEAGQEGRGGGRGGRGAACRRVQRVGVPRQGQKGGDVGGGEGAGGGEGLADGRGGEGGRGVSGESGARGEAKTKQSPLPLTRPSARTAAPPWPASAPGGAGRRGRKTRAGFFFFFGVEECLSE